jgi:hypothetical protein
MKPIVRRLPALLFSATLLAPVGSRPSGRDVADEYRNRDVTALVEDSESVRLAVGAAWDDALACRAFSGYLAPWTPEARSAEAETVVKNGARIYELVKCVDDGINSVRLARDSRDEPRLMDDVRFWRNELALAARQVAAYAAEAAALKERLAALLREQAAGRGISARFVEPIPWENPEREAWRRAGPAAGIRLPLEPRSGSLAEWWDRNLSVTPGYLVSKFRSAGDVFFTPEIPIGAWGANCTGENRYDWARLNRVVRLLHERGGRLLLELPTLQPLKPAAQITNEWAAANRNGDYVLGGDGYVACLPAYLASNPAASLMRRDNSGALIPDGGVQLFEPAVAESYGRYLAAMAANLREQGLYEAIAAIHLESGDWAELPESVDFSDRAAARWREFMRRRYGEIGKLNRTAGTSHGSFDDLPIPVRALDPGAASEWQAFRASSPSGDRNAWGRHLLNKFKTPEGIRIALGDDYRDGYGWRLPMVYAPVIGMDYLRFRREWVNEYLAVKRRLAAAAFPDKLIIAETRQAGDHDGVQGLGEKKWGGFLADDHAQWTGVGPANENLPFMIRSVGPVGFGTRPSDSLESLYRDYLWLHFRNPGNLARYFYHWVAHGYMDYQLGWQSVHSHWLSNQLLRRVGATVAETAPEPQRIGLLFPRATYDLANGDVYYGFMGWDWVLQAAKLPYTRVDEHRVRDGGLKSLPLQVLILPEVTALDDRVAAELAEWVKSGGTLIASTVPGTADEYGRARPKPALADVIGAEVSGTVCEAVKDTPLTVTIPHGHYSGKWQQTTDRRPRFEALAPGPDARVLAVYESGRPAIVGHPHGRGMALTMGYPFGREAVECERTSIGFQRTYVWFVREPQLAARVAWLRRLLTEQLGFQPEYDVEWAEVERFKGVEEIAPGFHMPKGLSQDPADPFYIRTVGDPRPGHEIETVREAPDLAIRFFPRHRGGLPTRYLGISTREVHYLGPRALVNMVLARHVYHCRINNPRIQAIWDVARDVPVGFRRDERGVSFTVSLPSGHIMMLAVSETPEVALFRPADFPGRDKSSVVERCRSLAGGKTPRRVTLLNPPEEIGAWFQALAGEPASAGSPAPKGGAKAKVIISYGDETNRAAAKRLAAWLGKRYGLDAEATAQLVKKPARMEDNLGREYEAARILIGNEWTNNDMAMHGAYWGISCGAHLPFTATYAWPGPGHAVVSLSRRYALTDPSGGIPFMATENLRLRPVQNDWPLLRRKLHVAGNGADAEVAVAELIRILE